MPALAHVPLRSRLLGAFGAVLVIVVGLSSAAYRTIALNQEANTWVEYSLRVISAANATFASLVEMETSYRGYLLTGNDVLLEPYDTSNAEVDGQLEDLITLAADSPAQARRWQEIRTRIDGWRTDVTEAGIALRRNVRDGRASQDDLNQFVVSSDGRQRFTAIRLILRDAIAVEEEFLVRRQAEAAAAGALLQTVLIGGTVLVTGLSLGLALLLTQDIVGPITRLATTAQAIAGGQYSQRVGLRRGDEIGIAADAFDRMTEQLEATILRSKAILDTAVEGIVGLDATGRITFSNPAAAQMLDTTEEALFGQDATSWIVPDKDLTPSASEASPAPTHRGLEKQPALLPPLHAGDAVGLAGRRMTGSLDPRVEADKGGAQQGRESAVSPVLLAVHQGITASGAGELIHQRNGHCRLDVEYACAPLRVDGELRGAVLTFRDITRRRAAQRMLEESNRELARSNADLEQFAYVASHDLQEPLRAIVSYLQLLERRYAEQLDERAGRYIRHAVDGGHRMQTLINALLTYSRIGRRSEEMQAVDMRAIFDRVLHSVQIAIEESQALVTCTEPLPTIVADQTQMHQLLQNLLVNAIKFRGEAPPRIHLWAERVGAAWQFSVQDNGIGIAPEYRERVFILFQRLHGRDEYAGAGIGLAVCKRIVERHGGELWVEDTPGGGSTFRFTIPDAESAPIQRTDGVNDRTPGAVPTTEGAGA